jgi:hypothetical protein
VLISKDRPLYDAIDIPLVSVFVDHPAQHIWRLNTKMNHLLVTCVDKAHLDFLSSYYPEEHFKVKSFMSMCGMQAAPFEEESFESYLKQRTIPVLFGGSLNKIEREWTTTNFSKNTVKLLDDITDYVLSKDCIALEDAYSYVVKERNIELSPELQRKVYGTFSYIYNYIWGYCRQRVLETLAKAEVPMVVYNKGETGYLAEGQYKSITFVGTKEYRELLRDFQKAKFSLNTTTNLVYGLSERVFGAMLGGAVPVSQANYSEELIDGENSVLYKWTKLDELPERLFKLLKTPETTWQMAQNAAKKANARHTWHNRAEQVVDMVEIYNDLRWIKFDYKTGGQ